MEFEKKWKVAFRPELRTRRELERIADFVKR